MPPTKKHTEGERKIQENVFLLYFLYFKDTRLDLTVKTSIYIFIEINSIILV